MNDLNPFPWYREMRATRPVSRDTYGYGWNVFRYADVQRVLSDHATFSSQVYGGGSPSIHQPFAASMLSTDPPRHRQLRALVSQAFTPRAVEALAPRIAVIVTDLLGAVGRAGRMDLIGDLGEPLPVIVIADLLGIPAADRARFKRWSDLVVSIGSGASYADHSAAIREMGTYFLNMIEQRRRAPGNDLISGLLAAEIDGERLGPAELLGFCALLLVAGNETTTHLIGNALLCFTEQPGLWQRLRADAALLPGAIEEALRYRSPVQSMFRVAAADTDLGGQTIRRGAPITVWLGSANRDEAAFPDADRFDIERAPNRHIAFGYGIHYCLGAPLARLEARVALAAMLERFASVERVAGVALERFPSQIVYGVKSLPITFEMKG